MPERPLRAVFLDVGNTLLHEQPSRFAIYAEVARAHGLDVDADGMHARMSGAHRSLPLRVDGHFRYSDRWFEAFIAEVFGDCGWTARELRAVTEELFDRFESASTFRLFPGAIELLRDVRARGIRVGAISNWSARLPRVLAALGLDQAFDFVLCSAIEEVEKPDPRIFERALRRADVEPSEALHAGDRPDLDVQAARAVGIRAVLVDHGAESGRTSDPAQASERVSDLFALARLVRERSR